MSRQITTLTALLANTLLVLFSSTVVADNPIFGFSPSDPSCTACLDQVVASCPGFYQDRSVATCICGDGGSTAVIACTSNSCDPGVNSPANAGRMWYNYCTQFFPAELCPGAEMYMSSEIFQDQCNPEAIARGGLGSDGGGGGGTDSGSSGDSERASSTSVAGPTAPIRPTDTTSSSTTSSSGTGTGTADSTSQSAKSSSANVAAMVPAGGVVLGLLGLSQLLGMMM